MIYICYHFRTGGKIIQNRPICFAANTFFSINEYFLDFRIGFLPKVLCDELRLKSNAFPKKVKMWEIHSKRSCVRNKSYKHCVPINYRLSFNNVKCIFLCFQFEFCFFFVNLFSTAIYMILNRACNGKNMHWHQYS